jgi:hypothetical protein
MLTIHDPTAALLDALIAGDHKRLRSDFAGEPILDDPLGGHVGSSADLERYARERYVWLAEREARVEPLRMTLTDRRTVFESLLHLRLPDQKLALPVAVVGERAGNDQVHALRIYHSLWPLYGAHQMRAPLLARDPAAAVSDVVAEYQHALATGDVQAIVNTFEPDGYFREPAGGEHVFRGYEKLREFMTNILSAGGIGLEHCTVTDDGVACAIEFNAVRFGHQPLAPQAGVAVYERGPSGRLHAARVYDDVNVETLAQADKPQAHGSKLG